MTSIRIAKNKKPVPLRIIFILNACKILLSFGIYIVFSIKDISIGGLDPILILYTALGYVATFGAMVFFILRKNILGLRIITGIDLLISLPLKAFIGIAIAIVSFLLTFNKKVKEYFFTM